MDQKKNLQAGGEPRREFLKKTATAAAAVAAVNVFKTPVYGQNQAPSAGRVIGANDRIIVGYIGVGGQGMAHVRSQKSHAADNNIQQVAVCDVSKTRISDAKKYIGGEVEGISDHRKLLERKDIDAVTIATVDHWHTRCSVDAMEAGKHVYVEKPMTRYLGEAFEIYDAVKRTGRILQVGSQGCTAKAWHQAADWIRSGKIGPVVWGQGYYCRNNPKGEWNYDIKDWCTPDDLDWNHWVGPVHKKEVPAELRPDHYFRWRKYYPYCAGLLGDLVPHRLYPLMLATGNPEFPVRVTCIGTKAIHTDRNTPGTPERDVPEHIELLAEFPSGLTLVIASSTVNAKSPGFVIYGHKATLNIGNMGEKIELLPEKEFSEEIDPETASGLTPTEDIGMHEKNWFESIRANKQPNANIDLAVRAQTVISLAEMSQRLRVVCEFDANTRKVMANGKEIEPITYGTLELS